MCGAPHPRPAAAACIARPWRRRRRRRRGTCRGGHGSAGARHQQPRRARTPADRAGAGVPAGGGGAGDSAHQGTAAGQVATRHVCRPHMIPRLPRLCKHSKSYMQPRPCASLPPPLPPSFHAFFLPPPMPTSSFPPLDPPTLSVL
eukprot:351305-Chlamydomonas_euryale.AAC.1